MGYPFLRKRSRCNSFEIRTFTKQTQRKVLDIFNDEIKENNKIKKTFTGNIQVISASFMVFLSIFPFLKTEIDEKKSKS